MAASMKSEHAMRTPHQPPHPSAIQAPAPAPALGAHVLAILRCPATKEPLHLEHQPGATASWLVNQSGTKRYPVIDGLPVLTRLP